MEPMVPVNIQTFSYPELPEYGTSVDDFTPSGWEVLDSTSGDLDKNKNADIALVPQYKDCVHIEETFAQPRVLAILFKDAGKDRYRLAEQSNTFILRDDEPDREDPFSGISIKNGILQMDFHFFYTMGSWSMTGSSYKFRYQGDTFVLIGADKNVYARNTGDSEDYSYNFLTKKRRLITANDSEESGKDDTTWSRIAIDTLRTLKTFDQPISWEVDPDGTL